MNLRVQTPSYEQRAIAHYTAVRKRLLAPKKPKPVVVIGEPVVRRVIVAPPVWRKADTQFDAHVRDWRRYISDQRTRPQKYLRRRCTELGYAIEDITGPSQTHILSKPRQRLMLEIKTTFPCMSFRQIGLIFGGRSKNTVTHGVNKASAEMAMESE